MLVCPAHSHKDGRYVHVCALFSCLKQMGWLHSLSRFPCAATNKTDRKASICDCLRLVSFRLQAHVVCVSFESWRVCVCVSVDMRMSGE